MAGPLMPFPVSLYNSPFARPLSLGQPQAFAPAFPGILLPPVSGAWPGVHPAASLPGAASAAPPLVSPTDEALQKRFPGKYARPAKPEPLKGLARNLKETVTTLGQVVRQEPVKDAQLVTLDDNAKKAGSLVIATLATLGLKQRILGVNEYMGLLSWFAAMSLTPQVINGLVKLKTGVDLGQKYHSTYGPRKNIYEDPHYLPLHILPDETVNRVADRLKIPYGPGRRQQTEDKMRQISVQTHTGWMLVAGPATPVLSGLLCDMLQEPVLRQMNRLLAGRAHWAVQNAKARHDADLLAKTSEAYLNRLVGEVTESDLSSWWKDFGKGIVNRTGLNGALSIKDVLNGDAADLHRKIAEHLGRSHRLKWRDGKPDHLNATLDYLDRQYRVEVKQSGMKAPVYIKHGQLEALREKANRFLHETYSDALGEVDNFLREIQEAKDEVKDPQGRLAGFRARLRDPLEPEPFRDLHGLLKDFVSQKEAQVRGAKNPELKKAAQAELEAFEKKVGAFLDAFDKNKLAQSFQRQSDFVTRRILNAQSTITHYRDVMHEVRRSIQYNVDVTDRLAPLMRNTRHSVVQNLWEQGREQEAARLVGREWPPLLEKIKASKGYASELLGADPQGHLVKTLRSLKLGALWRNRMIYGLGGGLLTLTALYNWLVVGVNFKKPSPAPGGKP